MTAQMFSAERIPICPRCGSDLVAVPDDLSLLVCSGGDGWTCPSLQHDDHGIRKRPALVDAHHLGTDDLTTCRENSTRSAREEMTSETVARVDAQGNPIKRAMLAGALTRGTNQARKSWKEQQLEKYWLDNCDRLSPEDLQRGRGYFRRKSTERRRHTGTR